MMFANKEVVCMAFGSGIAVLAAVFDVRTRKIPNRLTGFAFLFALLLHLELDGWRGLLTCLAAAAIAGGIFLIFFLVGGMGGGDVKLMTAIGAAAGLSGVANVLILTSLAGGALALFIAFRHHRLSDMFRNMGSIFTHFFSAGMTPHPEINVSNTSMLRMPYAVSIAIGSLLTTYILMARG